MILSFFPKGLLIIFIFILRINYIALGEAHLDAKSKGSTYSYSGLRTV